MAVSAGSGQSSGRANLRIFPGWVITVRPTRRVGCPPSKLCTRMGGMLDPLADLALLTFLAFGLYLAGVIRGPLLLLLVVRYPILLIGVLIMFFVRGPGPLRPTLIGKVTTFATSMVLLIIALNTLLPIAWPPPLWLEWSVRFLYVLISVNILYLINRGVAWTSRRKDSSDPNRKSTK